jgi:hypothetical protein
MGKKESNDQYTDEEATRRMNEALRRSLTSPPKPHSEMKIGKRKAKADAKDGTPKNETDHAK